MHECQIWEVPRYIGRCLLISNCPGCKKNHVFLIGNNDPKRNWEFNNNFESPTFHPSMLVKSTEYVCHFILTDGTFHFQSDSTHMLAGNVVPCKWSSRKQ